MARFFLQNHVFANLTFALVLVIGFLSYGLLPRQQDPDMNFNWIQVITILPGASAEDVEKRITDPLEEALEKVPDIRFVSSGSRESTSTILVRFNDIDTRTFDKRVNDLRREIQNKERELPEEAEDPLILEITSANGFPTAMVVVMGQADDENLRRQARHVKKDLERLKGVDTVAPLALREPEIQIRFLPDKLLGLGISPLHLADTVAARFHNISAGTIRVGKEDWLLRLEGNTPDPQELASWPVVGAQGEVTLGEVAEIARSRKKARFQVGMNNRPAVLLTLTKQPNVNALDLTARVREYLKTREEIRNTTGVDVVLADDQTHMVQNALGVMEKNALLGLAMVMVATWIFLGSRIAILIGLGIPFTLAGTFGLTYATDGSMNVMLLLGVVISLGMLVDDAVVVVEAIYAQIQRGQDAMSAGLAALQEVAAPVTTSVLTTMAAFLPLMLLPGILGKFMRVIPMVVTIALAISLVEAFWMLPAHIAALNLNFSSPSRMHRLRTRFLQNLRRHYVRWLTRVLRRPQFFLTMAILPFIVAVGVVSQGLVRMEFFAMDPLPLYYVNVEMPPGSPLQNTIDTTLRVAERVEAGLREGEARAVVSYAGQMFTETRPFFGDRYGQILVSLNPDRSKRREVKAIIEGMREAVTTVAGPRIISFLPLSGGPPVTKPISVKVRGDTFEEIMPAVKAVIGILEKIPEVHDITDNFSEGRAELVLKPNGDAIRQAGLHPTTILRLSRLLADGEEVASLQHQGEKIAVRVLAKPETLTDIGTLLRFSVPGPDGRQIPLEELTDQRVRHGIDAIRHYNFRRAVTVEAELDKEKLDTVTANDRLKKAWEEVRHDYPGVNLDFSGVLDDINESMDAIVTLFLFGVGLMYMILGTQFGSYFQPFMILTTVPMAFTGVVFGLLITGHPLSLYTLYGVVALSGIAVNASIVLIAAANSRRREGMSVLHAIIFAARRRVIPIVITSLTTIAGLSSLAMGLAGHSLLWGPVATAIVWGLGFSTFLTLFLVPLLYWTFMGSRERARQKTKTPPPPPPPPRKKNPHPTIPPPEKT
ncbi:MAG: efflux RND transporter permease subunit, partial [Magnetococcales bacterium]|nr:efflux RND transporter permease subunit [Magnetococcales bacterium]